MTQKDQNLSKDKLNNVAEPSGTAHGGSPRGSFSNPFLQALSSPFHQRGFLFRARSACADPTRPRNLTRNPEADPHQLVGLGAVAALSRAPTNTNKNLLLSINIGHRAPPVQPPNPSPAGGGARLGGVNGSAGRNMVSDRVLLDVGCSAEASSSPRKKVKRSEEDHGSLQGSVAVTDNSGFDPVSYPTSAFMSHCFTCTKKLMHNEDIYILRGEMAFCTNECREREILKREKRRERRRAKASSSEPRAITRSRSLRELSPVGYDGLPH